MRKYILLFLAVGCSICLMAQGDTMETNTTTEGISAVFDLLSRLISENVWTTVFVVAFILEQIIAAVKWTPSNSTAQLVWNFLRKVVSFLASKKKAQK